MRLFIIVIKIIFLLLSTSILKAQISRQGSLKLQYDTPADTKVVEQALSLGNGFLDLMVYGIPHHEELQWIDDYNRELDLDKALAKSSYKIYGVTYTRELFS